MRIGRLGELLLSVRGDLLTVQQAIPAINQGSVDPDGALNFDLNAETSIRIQAIHRHETERIPI